MAALVLNWEGRELTFLKENVFIGFQVALGPFGISKVKLWDRKAYVSDPRCSPGLPVTLSFSAATCSSTTVSHTPSSTATQPWTWVGLHLNFCFASCWSRLLGPWLGRALPLSGLTAVSATWFSDHCLLLACWILFSSLPLCLLSCLQSIQIFFTLILLLLRPPWQIPSMACNFFFLNLFIYLFMAVLGLRFCARAFSSCGKRGPLFIAVHGLLTIAASLVAEHKLQMRRLSSCGSRAQLLHGMWDLPRPGLEPVSPALAGRFLTTAPPGKPWLAIW